MCGCSTIKCLCTNESQLSNLVTSIVLSVEESVVSELRECIGISKDGFELVIVPPFVDICASVTNCKDVCVGGSVI
jgi:hypothetical protein